MINVTVTLRQISELTGAIRVPDSIVRKGRTEDYISDNFHDVTWYDEIPLEDLDWEYEIEDEDEDEEDEDD